MGYQFMGLHCYVRNSFKPASMIQTMGIGIIRQGDKADGSEAFFGGLLFGQRYQLGTDTVSPEILIDTQGVDIKAVFNATGQNMLEMFQPVCRIKLSHLIADNMAA